MDSKKKNYRGNYDKTVFGKTLQLTPKWTHGHP